MSASVAQVASALASFALPPRSLCSDAGALRCTAIRSCRPPGQRCYFRRFDPLPLAARVARGYSAGCGERSAPARPASEATLPVGGEVSSGGRGVLGPRPAKAAGWGSVWFGRFAGTWLASSQGQTPPVPPDYGETADFWA